MDLVNAAVGLQQAKLTSEVQIRVARKMLDMQDQQGGAALKLLDAADAGFSKASNAMVAAATGLGSQVDVNG
jgi:hypothetical protein